MRDKLLIIGASGHGKVVADIAFKMNKWKEVAFLDDNLKIKSSMGLKVIGTVDNFKFYIKEYEIFVGIGNNFIRQSIYENLEAYGAEIPKLIHPNSIIGGNVKIGKGTAIMAGAIVNCSTKIGKGCIINTGSIIEHDNCIDNFVHISPGVCLAGSVKVGESSWIGLGSNVSNNISITNKCIIGAGSTVIEDISYNGVYVGAPAKKIKEL